MVGWELQLGDLGSLGVAFWVSTVVAMIGIVVPTAVAVYFYRKSRRIKLLAYTVTTSILIQDFSAKLSGLKIEYKGKNPANISVSRIAIWNEGTETINRPDIPQVEPLTIISESEILDSSVISITAPSNQFTVVPFSPFLLTVGFDYLDRNEGAIVQLVHTGKLTGRIFFAGRVKGSGQPVRREFGPHPILARIADRMLTPSVVFVTIGVLGTFLTTGNLRDYSLLVSLIGVVLFFGSLIFAYAAGRVGTVPKQFESARSIV